MVRQGPTCRGPRLIRPALHGGVTRRSRFSNFLSCERVADVEGVKDVSVSFVWPSGRQATGGPLQGASPQMLAALASTASAFGGSGAMAGMHPDVSMACIPFLAPGWGLDGEDRAASSQEENDGLTVRARTLQRGLAGSCIAQAAMATLQFALNDGISGLIGCAIGTLGMQAASPSGYRFLPSYIVLAFTNGTMQVLVGSELAASHHLLAHTSVASIKLASLVSVASPMLMFLGMAVAWHLHCELRAIALQALPPSMRNQLVATPPPIDGVSGIGANAPIGQGGSAAELAGPFRAFSGQSRRLEGEAK